MISTSSTPPTSPEHTTKTLKARYKPAEPLLLQQEKKRAPQDDASSNNRREIASVIYSIDKFNKRADERWVRYIQEISPERFLGPMVLVLLFTPVLLVAGIMAVFLGDVPTAVLYAPMAFVNFIVLVLFELMMLICVANPPPWFRDNFTMSLFIIAELTLIAQLWVFVMNIFQLTEVYTDSSMDGKLAFLRHLNSIAGFMSVSIALITTMSTYSARPNDTEVAILNLPVL